MVVSAEHVEGINAWIQYALPVQQVLTCYHDDADQCTCRKPKPGLLFEQAAGVGRGIAGDVMVGDRWK